jgi:hypothetical protein
MRGMGITVLLASMVLCRCDNFNVYDGPGDPADGAADHADAAVIADHADAMVADVGPDAVGPDAGCAPGTVACTAGQCVNTQTDPANCGSCGFLCIGGATCTAGICGCPGGQTFCGSACVDLSSDPANCGACGATCARCMTGGCAPANDTCATAIPLAAGVMVSGTTCHADVSAASECGSLPDVFYSITNTHSTSVVVNVAVSGSVSLTGWINECGVGIPGCSSSVTNVSLAPGDYLIVEVVGACTGFTIAATGF